MANADYPLTSAGAAIAGGVDYFGGRGVFYAVASNWAGGSATLQWSPDGTNWINVDKTGDTFCTLSASGSGGFELPECKVRVSVSGSPTGLVAGVRALPK